MPRKYRVVDIYNRQLLSMEPYVSLRDAEHVVKMFHTRKSEIQRYDEKEHEWVRYEPNGSRNRSGRSAKFRTVTLDPVTMMATSTSGRWVSFREAARVADLWERNGANNVAVVDQAGTIHLQLGNNRVPSTLAKRQAMTPANRNRSGRRDPFGYRAMMKERAAREKEEEKLKRWGVFPFTEDNGAVNMSRGYVAREANETTGAGKHFPYNTVTAVRIFKRRADADKLASKMTFGDGNRNRSGSKRTKPLHHNSLVGRAARTTRLISGVPVSIPSYTLVDVITERNVGTKRHPEIRYAVAYAGTTYWVDEDALEA